jgi:hypothetical protein
MMRVPAAWFDSVTTFTIVTAARGWWDINEGRKGTQELQHWKVEYTTTEGRKSEGFLLFFNFDVTSSTIRKSTNTTIDDTGTEGSNCTRTSCAKASSNISLHHPTTNRLYHHTSRNGGHRKRTSRCESASPPSHQYHEHNQQQMRICTPSQKSHPPALSCRLPADKNAKLHSFPSTLRHLQPPPPIGFPSLHPIGRKLKGPFRARKIGRELASRYWPGCIFVNLQRRHPTWWGLRCAAPTHVVGGRMVPTENPIPLREGGWMDGWMDGEERS